MIERDIFHKIFRILDKDYVITSTNGKNEMEIGYVNTQITKITIEVIKP